MFFKPLLTVIAAISVFVSPAVYVSAQVDRSAYAVGDRSGYRAELTDDERRELHLAGITVEDDEDLRKRRAICDEGRMPAFRQTLEDEGTPFPAAHIFCRATLREEGKRGRMNSYRHKGDFSAISAAIRNRTLTYTSFEGHTEALICERAYDLGYQLGWNRPDWDFQSQLRGDAQSNAEQCFAHDTFQPALGFIAGIHHAQADKRARN